MAVPTPAHPTRAGDDLPGRVLGVLHAAVGTVLCVRPTAVGPITGAAAPSLWVVRALGLRSLLQGTVTAAVPDEPVVAAGAIVDGAHAVSMFAIALGSPRHRRAALFSAALATAYCVAGAGAARMSRVRRSGA